MIELHLSDELIKQQEDQAVCLACAGFLDGDPATHDGWRETIPLDDQVSASKMLAAARGMARGAGREDELLRQVYLARTRARMKSAWRIEGTLREFPRFEPVNLWFEYPLHRADTDGVLKDSNPEGEQLTREGYRAQGRERKARNDERRQAEKLSALREGMDACDRDGVERTIANVVERMPEVGGKQVSKSTVNQWIAPGRNKWCPVVSEGGKGTQPGRLKDPEEEAMLKEW